jgi:hypothetical protein
MEIIEIGSVSTDQLIKLKDGSVRKIASNAMAFVELPITVPIPPSDAAAGTPTKKARS